MEIDTIKKGFFALLALELFAEVISQWTNNHILIYLVKPLLMPALMVYLWQSVKKPMSLLYKVIMAALFFSFLGDVFLILPSASKQFFLFGLVFFLIAHLFYIYGFRKVPDKLEDQTSTLNFALPIILYFAVLLILLFVFGNAEFSEMKFPVIIYTLVILTMVLTSFRRQGSVSLKSYQWVVWGAILFMLSDSMIAISKFTNAFNAIPTVARVLIMSTYAIGQYYIVKGCIEQEKTSRI